MGPSSMLKDEIHVSDTWYTLSKNCKSIHIRFLQKILFYHLKSYFIIYTIPFYNTPNIQTFILSYHTLK